jgi:hypothetical protein
VMSAVVGMTMFLGLRDICCCRHDNLGWCS